MRLTYSSAKQQLSHYAGNGLCVDDPRVLEKLNEARERLMKTDKKWKGTVASFVTCINDGCITLPREIQTIEGVSICGATVPIRNQWYEFNPNGPGINPCLESFQDRGDGYPTFRDICGARKIHVYTDVMETGQILLQGFDENNNEIRTQSEDGTWVNGEYVSMAGGEAFSVNLFTALSGVQKPVTNGYIRLYAYDPDSLKEYGIGFYHPDETLPGYRRYELGGWNNLADGAQVSVIGILRYLPITRDSDYIVIENMGALKNMLIALEKEDHNMLKEAALYQLRAENILREELNQYLGDSTTGTFQVQGECFGAGEIAAYL